MTCATRVIMAMMFGFSLVACSTTPRLEGEMTGDGGTSGGDSGIEDHDSGPADGSIGAIDGSATPDGSTDAGNAPASVFVYVGSGDWGGGAVGRVEAHRLDLASGALTRIDGVEVGQLNSYLALDPSRSMLYAADEAGQKLHALRVDESTGELSFANTVDAAGGPVYVRVDASGKYVLTCFYNQGSSQVFAVQSDGTLGASVDTDASGAQSHAIVLSPTNTHVFVPSKAENKISQYLFDPATGVLTRNGTFAAPLAGGPRHLTFHPTLPRAYVVNELENSVAVFDYDATTGRLAWRQTLARLPDGTSGSGADIHVAPSGNFVYASNRSDDASSIAVYAVNATSGELTLVEHEPTRGRTPRTFTIDPTGKWLIAANQDSNSLAVFSIDSATGRLTFLETHPLTSKPFYVGAFGF